LPTAVTAYSHPPSAIVTSLDMFVPFIFAE
jgi:hypothetical protein